MKKRYILYAASGIMLVLVLVVSSISKMSTNPDPIELDSSEAPEDTEESTSAITPTLTLTPTPTLTPSPTPTPTLTPTPEPESETERQTETDSAEVVDFTIPQWPDGVLPLITYDEPVGLGSREITFSESYEDNTYVTIYQYGTYLNVHTARFAGVAFEWDMVKEVLESYVGADLQDFALHLDRTMSEQLGGVVWHAYFSAEDAYGGSYIYRGTYVQLGEWDVMYLVSIPIGARDVCLPYAESSMGTVKIEQVQQ